MEFSEADMANPDDFGSMKEPGRYLVEVKRVDEKRNSNNDNQWGLQFKDVESGLTVCWDNLIFSQGGRGIAFTKMAMLGVPKNQYGKYSVGSKDELMGMRAYITTVEDVYQGKERLKVDFNCDGFGYEPEFENAVAGGKDDIPF